MRAQRLVPRDSAQRARTTRPEVTELERQMLRESPKGAVTARRPGTGPALRGAREVGLGKPETPGDLDRRSPVKSAPNPAETERHIAPPANAPHPTPTHTPGLRAWRGDSRPGPRLFGPVRPRQPAGGKMFVSTARLGLKPEPKIEAEIN